MASSTCQLEMTRDAKCEAHKFYGMIKYTLHHLPNIFPESYKSSEILEGDGESVGSIRLWKYVLPGTTELLTCKEKAEVIDDENMLIVLDIYEGEHTAHYSCFKVTMQVVPKGEGCSVKWITEYEKGHEGAVDPHLYMEMFTGVHDKLDAHILAKA